MRNVEKLIVALLIVAGVAIAACTEKEAVKPEGAAPAAVAPPEHQGGMQKTSSGLAYTDLVVGTGPSPVQGRGVKVHYTGWLEDGAKFDSSYDRKEPFSFTFGAGEVIPGWDEALKTMKVGGRRKVVIPPRLAYGAQGAGGVIPPNATLTFEIELLDVEK